MRPYSEPFLSTAEAKLNAYVQPTIQKCKRRTNAISAGCARDSYNTAKLVLALVQIDIMIVRTPSLVWRLIFIGFLLVRFARYDSSEDDIFAVPFVCFLLLTTFFFIVFALHFNGQRNANSQAEQKTFNKKPIMFCKYSTSLNILSRAVNA